MVKHNVRSTISQHVISQLGAPGMDIDLQASTVSLPVMPAQTDFGETLALEHPPPAETIRMDPLYVHTQRELDELLRDMGPHFEGKESEHNWMPRDKSVLKLRRLLKGNAPQEFQPALVAGFKTLLDGIIKVSTSLRTTMATNGCHLVQEMARTLGPAMDSMVELLMQTFVKICAATKKIASANGNETVDVILAHVSYNLRLIQHIQFAFQDKNVQPRQYATGWLKTIIRKHAQHKAHVDHSGGTDIIVQCIKKGLADANPGVRESTRGAYWTFARVWPQRAEAIMATLTEKDKGSLEKDPGNPNASMASSQSSGKSVFSKSVGPGTAGSRQTLKETIAAQKKAKLAQSKMPERPNSAMGTMTPLKSAASTNSLRAQATGTARPPSAASTSSRSVLASSTASTSAGGSLMSAPLRRPRRPELARPATADPYHAANKRSGKPNTPTPTMSPAASPEKSTTTKKTATRPTSISRPKTALGTSPGSGKGQSPNISPAKSFSRSRTDVTTHRKTPSAGDPPRYASPGPSPSKAEDLTMVVPFSKLPNRPGMPSTMSVDTGLPLMSEEDGFTMVIPNLQGAKSRTPTKIPTPGRTPQRPSPGRQALMDEMALEQPFVARSPRPARSPERITAGVMPQEVQVYEDPFVADEPAAPVDDAEKPVLEELPINDLNGTTDVPSFNDERTTSPLKNVSAPNVDMDPNQDRAEVLRNRRLLSSGIDRIRAKQLDAHGFRRLQDLVKSRMDIWGADGIKFQELLLTLLDFLESPLPSSTQGSKAQNLRTQALGTVRAMLSLYRKESAPYCTRALCAVLSATKGYDSTAHLSTELTKTAEDIARLGHPSECIDAVLDLLEFQAASSPTSSGQSSGSLSPEPDHSSRQIVSSLHILSMLLSNPKTSLDSAQIQRSGQVAVRELNALDPDVRKADLDFCLALHDKVSDNAMFWKAMGGAREGHLNLLTYYLAKREKNQIQA